MLRKTLPGLGQAYLHTLSSSPGRAVRYLLIWLNVADPSAQLRSPPASVKLKFVNTSGFEELVPIGTHRLEP
jgi:hypothetical protein